MIGQGEIGSEPGSRGELPAVGAEESSDEARITGGLERSDMKKRCEAQRSPSRGPQHARFSRDGVGAACIRSRGMIAGEKPCGGLERSDRKKKSPESPRSRVIVVIEKQESVVIPACAASPGWELLIELQFDRPRAEASLVTLAEQAKSQGLLLIAQKASKARGHEQVAAN